MRFIKKSMAFALVAAMIVTLAPSNGAVAAKKVKLNKKTAEVKVGKTVTIKVKNAKKSAKVTWKSSNNKVAKIKKSTKKGNASATVLGLKKGKATIKATVKTGKKKTTKKCTVYVRAKDPVVPTPTIQPTQGPVEPTPTTQATTEPTGEPTKAPTTRKPSTPTPVPTPEPTKIPIEEYEFEEVTNGIAIDVATYEHIEGSGAYNSEKGYVEVNDGSASDKSQGTWVLPPTIPTIQLGDEVTFRVQGYNKGTSGFRFWIGTGTSGCCTPVQFGITDEKLKLGECGYPEVITVEEEGQEVKKTMNQVAVNYVDEDKGAFDITFTLKAGTSQDDTNGACPNLTLKYIMDGDTSGYINGLCIKHIYYITGDPVTPPTPGENLPTLDENAQAVEGRATAIKTDTAVTVDGVMEEAWDAADFVKLDYYSHEAGETKAQAKFMWDEDNLYVLAVVADPLIDATSGDNYKRDGVEVFLDEDNSKEETYDDNADAFQYRFTGFEKDDKGVWAEATTKVVTTGNETDYEINSAYKAYDDGYVVEMAIPFKDKEAIAADKVLGFELTVMDCAGGDRANEIWLTGTGKGEMYQNPSLFGEIKLVGPVDISSAQPLYGKGKVTVNDDGTVSGTGVEGIVLPLGRTINTGDTVNIKVYAEAGAGTRLWLTDSSNGVCSDIINPLKFGTKYTVTATADNISLFQIKGLSPGDTFDTLKINKVFVEVAE